jgi:hypothetical protein
VCCATLGAAQVSDPHYVRVVVECLQHSAEALERLETSPQEGANVGLSAGDADNIEVVRWADVDDHAPHDERG